MFLDDAECCSVRFHPLCDTPCVVFSSLLNCVVNGCSSGWDEKTTDVGVECVTPHLCGLVFDCSDGMIVLDVTFEISCDK